MISKIKIISAAVLLSFLAAAPALAHTSEPAEQSPRQNVKRLAQVQLNRAEKSLTRLEAILIRVEQVRSGLASKDADLTKIDALIAQAKTRKTQAQQSLAAAKEKYQGLDTSSKPREQVAAFMAVMKDLKGQLIQLHKDLKAAITAMKGIK